MSSEEAISTQPSAISSETGDPLAEAHCPKCGYSLRGLPENRCPECGTAFDPADFADAFLPLWPRLLMWYLIVRVIESMFDLPHATHILWSWISPASSSTIYTWTLTNFVDLTSEALLITLCPLATWGLYRRSDWARKACIAVFVAHCLEPVADLVSFVFDLIDRGAMGPVRNTLFLTTAYVSSCVSPLLLIAFLATGLRRHSLRRARDTRPSLLPLGLYHPRHDWLLLTVLVLVGMGFARTCWGISSLSHFLPLLLGSPSWSFRPPISTWDLACEGVYFALTTATGACAIVAAVWIWRRTRILRRMLTVLTALAALHLPLPILLIIGDSYLVSRLMDSGMTEDVASLANSFVGPVLTPLTLLLFALVVVKPEDIDRLALEKGCAAA